MENLSIVNEKLDYKKDLLSLNSKVDSLNLEDESKFFVHSKIEKLIREENDTPYYLSGGEKQLLSFIRSMIKPSNILFADEPWASMDKHLKSFIESQMYAYLSDEDIFSDIRNRESQLKDKKIVMVISHPLHHARSSKEFGKKEEAWTKKIPIYKDNKKTENPPKLIVERYIRI